MQLTVECKSRPEGRKPKALRREGFVPAVLYGHDGTNSLELVVEEKSVQQLLKDPNVSNSLIKVTVADGGWSGQTLLREVQMHPWRGYPYHLSFFSVASQATVQVDLPLNFVGEPVGVERDGGILETQVNEVAVECAPDNIPETIDIDVSALEMGGSMHLSEVTFPEGVRAVTDTDLLLVTIQAPRVAQTEDDESATSEASKLLDALEEASED
jgi:large subunit ribosomal protein L25